MSTCNGAPNHETPMILPPDRTASMAWQEALHAREPLLRTAAGALENHVSAIAACQVADDFYRVGSRAVDGAVRSEFFRNLCRLRPHIYRYDLPRAAGPRDLHALQSHAALAED